MTVEYAKFAKVQVTPVGRGIQAALKLPASYNCSSSSGSIRFFVGFDDLECGIETACGAPGWRWFADSGAAAGSGERGEYGEFNNGDSVKIKMTLDDTEHKVKFFVNGELKTTFSTAYSAATTFTNCRLVLGAFMVSPTSGADELPQWEVVHELVTVGGLMYKSADQTWMPITSANATPSVFHTPAGEGEACCPEAYKFDMSELDSSRVCASIDV
ncbi:hypothetical protein B5M42_007205 [Paenibacillus athensensis]|uniref:Uncharacterized protein n=1 Tax=Paenibacillus athensensis TaxID=1967502 RepID=A0A4Y8Q287_9BACL|nr:hypothetical protein [Paenibacillus athensensis]MCD1258619.1 hypothetical protein [Paenibacillus athensensis]